MDTPELVNLIKTEVRASVAEGMQAHREQDHDPIWNQLNALREALSFYKGAFWALAGSCGLVFTVLTIIVTYFHK